MNFNSKSIISIINYKENRLLKKAAELSAWGKNGRSLRRLNPGKSGGGAG